MLIELIQEWYFRFFLPKGFHFNWAIIIPDLWLVAILINSTKRHRLPLGIGIIVQHLVYLNVLFQRFIPYTGIFGVALQVGPLVRSQKVSTSWIRPGVVAPPLHSHPFDSRPTVPSNPVTYALPVDEHYHLLLRWTTMLPFLYSTPCSPSPMGKVELLKDVCLATPEISRAKSAPLIRLPMHKTSWFIKSCGIS